eukprot:gene18435-24911_t
MCTYLVQVVVTTSDKRGAGTDANVNLTLHEVVVKTSDKRGSGTDANVHLTLHGEAPDGKALNSGSMRLENSANNFERGMVETFDVNAKVGQVKFIKIGHDNTGLGPSWHLQARIVRHVDEVILLSPGIPDMQFLANRWLATDEGDKQTYAVLYPSGEGAQMPHKYRVQN